MLLRLLMTDGGAHPPEALASMTAQRIVDDFSGNAPEAVYRDVQAFRERIEPILAEHHRIAQTQERAALRFEGSSRLAKAIDTGQHVPDALDDIIAAAHETDAGGQPRWPSLVHYFARPQTRQYLEDVLHMEFHQTAHIERSWHAQGHYLYDSGQAEFDAYPENAAHPAARAFLAVNAQGSSLLTLPDPGEPQQLSDLAEHGGRELVSAMVANMIPKTTPKAEA